MSGFLKTRENMKAEIDASHKWLTDLKSKMDKVSNVIYWMLIEKNQLERTAARIDQLNAETDKAEIGTIEDDVDRTMTLLNENFKAINKKLAVIGVTQTMAGEIRETMFETRDKFEKTTCDIIHYKCTKNGKMNVKECHQLKSTDKNYYEFATATLTSTIESPLQIDLWSLPVKGSNEHTHHLREIIQGNKFVSGYSMCSKELLTINGLYLKELNSDEVKAVMKRQIATGKVVLEILQQKNGWAKNGIIFERIDDQNSTVEKSTILEVEPAVIKLEENKVVSTEKSEKEVEQVNVQTTTLAADPPTCTVAAAGGVSNHQLVNSGTEKLIFKVKSSNNNEYRIKPVFGVVEPGASTALQVTRTSGAPKEDKLVVQYWPAPADATDVTDAFKQIKGNLTGTITITISATE